MSGLVSNIFPSDSLSGAPTVMARSKENLAGTNEKSRGSIEPFSGVMKMLYSLSPRSVRTETMSLCSVLKERMNSRTPEMEGSMCSGGLRKPKGSAIAVMPLPAMVTSLPMFSRKAPMPDAAPKASPLACSGTRMRMFVDFSMSSLTWSSGGRDIDRIFGDERESIGCVQRRL